VSPLMGRGVQNKPYDKIALVLQGGGALGSYQAGVYKALCEANYKPDWISGTSIGAINGAIIAGNSREESNKKLQYFWDKISNMDILQNMFSNDEMRKWYNYSSGLRTAFFGNPNMFYPCIPGIPFCQKDPETISLYNPAPLKALLHEVIDFDFLNNPGNTRLTIDAVNVRTGKGINFDNKTTPILLEHIMACCALPPAMPAVRIGNDLYWDGGVLSNTPLDAIMGEAARKNILCFMVDLFNPEGEEPDSLSKVLMRIKEISYASASDTHIAHFREAHNLRRALSNVASMLPEEEHNNITTQAFKNLGYDTTMHIVHLIYRPKYYEWDSKDYDFSKLAIDEHFNEGYLDAHWATKHSQWLEERPSDTGVVIQSIKRGTKPVAIFS
jgi:NTE family protein